jgi:flagellar hook-basal body complex protein FliE
MAIAPMIMPVIATSLTASPLAAAQAYRDTATGSGNFDDTLKRAIDGVVDTNKAAEAQSLQAIAGQGSITDVVTAVSKAELALQTTVAIRDRVVQAYQDIIKMPI